MAASSRGGGLHLHSIRNEIVIIPPLLSSRSSPDPSTALYLVSSPLPANISVLKFEITSHDQGWSSEPQNGCWTWFEVSILRQWQEDCCADFKDITGATYIKSCPEDFGEAIQNLGFYFEDIPLKQNDGDNTVPSSMISLPIMKNAVARNWQHHTIFWKWNDDNGDGARFLSLLKEGDRLAIWARAQFPGWVNYVREARITLSTQALQQSIEEDTAPAGVADKGKRPEQQYSENNGSEAHRSEKKKSVLFHRANHMDLEPLLSASSSFSEIDFVENAVLVPTVGMRQRMGATANHDEAIQIARKALNAALQDDTFRAMLLNNFVIQIGKRYSRTGVMADTVQASREAVKSMPESHPDRAAYLNDLGIQLGDKYSRTGVITDIEDSVRASREAVEATPEDHPDRAARLNNLGVGLVARYVRTGAMANLEEAIQVISEAVRATPEGHPARAVLLSNLGLHIGTRYSRTGAMADLEEAIKLLHQAVKVTPGNHPDRAMFFHYLSNQIGKRYSRTGAMADLTEAIQIGREAVDAMPENHRDRANCLDNLGIQLSLRYSRRGAIADLEEAIQLFREAVKATPDVDPNLPQFLNNLGAQLHFRYERTGAMADLEEAIQIGREAVNAMPEDHPDRATLLNTLGIQLRNKYSRIGSIFDLEEAIQVAKQAVKAIPEGSPNRAMFLHNLGNALIERYSRTGAMADLEEAIQVEREAVHSSPEDHPDRAIPLNGLVLHLLHKYSRTEAIAVLEEAIHVGREAVKATSEDHQNRTKLLSNLAQAFRLKHSRTGASADLEAAISYGQSALSQSNSTTDSRIQAGRMVLQYSAAISDWQQGFEASRIAVYLVPKLISRSLENSDKQHLLAQVVGLASDAAAAALNAGKEPLVALDLLEQGRGVLAASIEEMRTDILDLQQTHPQLAEEFLRLRNVLNLSATHNNSLIVENPESFRQAQARRRYEADKELDKLIVEIRKQPGYDDFLCAPSEQEMRLAAEYGPIVAINISQYRCDAILIEKHQIRCLALPKLDSKEIEGRARKGELGSPKVLEWLWDDIMSPILNALGFVESPSDHNFPRVWWIPTGTLTKFPLHAAGRHRIGSGETVLDRVMSSYSSSVKAIIHSRRRPAQSSTSAHALLVAMEYTPGNSRLPFTAKEVEMIRGLCKSMGIDPIQPGRHKQDVTLHLPQCSIFHFAGHGHTDDADPSKSHLLLEEGNSDPLTVANLLEMNLRKRSPFLAYLSACGTGQIRDERFVDESIHLVSAFQLAGFRHVIGTLWEVNDEICVDMARITYEGMGDGKMKDDTVCLGLHNATRKLRDRWLDMSSKARRELRSARKVCASLEKCKTEVGSVSDGGERDDRLPRDIVLCDTDTEDDGKGIGPLFWVPYIHFGV